MATTNNVVIPNVPTSGTPNIWFNQTWALTRALKKAGWVVIASSHTTKDTTANPENDRWIGTATATNAGGAAAAIASPALGRATVTGLTGIVSGDKGRFLHISGASNGANNHSHQIEEIISATSVRISARNQLGSSVVVAESGLTWEIRDPTVETYPSGNLAANQCWWAARGPSMLKVPIGSGAVVAGITGYKFLRGENVVQAGSGAEGEIVGIVEDTSGGAGYLVVAPRLRGGGAGPYGWAATGTLTGGLTGATVDTTATVLEYRGEIVIWKANNQFSGSVFFNIIEPVGQSAESFETLAAAAGCTASVAPGGGGTGNAFPAHAWVAHGSGTSGGAGFFSFVYLTPGSITTIGNAQIMVADAIEEEDYSADGSFVMAAHDTTLTGGGHQSAACFQRCDDSEDGDVYPYVSVYFGGSGTLYANDRTTFGTPQGSQTDKWTIANVSGAFGNSVGRRVKGWRRLGLSSESFQDFEVFIDRALTSAVQVMGANNTTPAIDASSPTTRKKREPIRVGSVQTSFKMHKGSLRWIGVVQGGNGHDTYDDKAWVQLSPDSGGPCVAGPWDGTSVPAGT